MCQVRGDGAGSVLDGNGEYWWAMHENKSENHTRGHLIEFMYSSDVVVANLVRMLALSTVVPPPR